MEVKVHSVPAGKISDYLNVTERYTFKIATIPFLRS